MINVNNLNLYFENRNGHGSGSSLNNPNFVKISQDGYIYEYDADGDFYQAQQIADAFKEASENESGCSCSIEKDDELYFTIETGC